MSAAFLAPALPDHDLGMAKRSKVHPNYKTRYRVTNWPSYDRGLVERGSLTVWFSPEAITKVEYASAIWIGLTSAAPIVEEGNRSISVRIPIRRAV